MESSFYDTANTVPCASKRRETSFPRRQPFSQDWNCSLLLRNPSISQPCLCWSKVPQVDTINYHLLPKSTCPPSFASQTHAGVATLLMISLESPNVASLALLVQDPATRYNGLSPTKKHAPTREHMLTKLQSQTQARGIRASERGGRATAQSSQRDRANRMSCISIQINSTKGEERGTDLSIRICEEDIDHGVARCMNRAGLGTVIDKTAPF